MIPKPGRRNSMVKEMDGDLRHQGAEDAIQGVEDEFQDEKGDPQGQDDQDSCKDLCPEVFQNSLDHGFADGD